MKIFKYQQTMREIKFRGKRKDNGEWVYGDLCHWNGDPDRPCIECNHREEFGQHYKDAYEVNSATVGQFTGAKDKGGKEIYEGDILVCEYNEPAKVVWDEKWATFELDNGQGNFIETMNVPKMPIYRINGNIHDREEGAE